MYIAMPMTAVQTAPPVADVIATRNAPSSPPPKREIIAVSSDSIDTIAATRFIAFDADSMGLLCRRVRTMLTAAVMTA